MGVRCRQVFVQILRLDVRRQTSSAPLESDFARPAKVRERRRYWGRPQAVMKYDTLAQPRGDAPPLSGYCRALGGYLPRLLSTKVPARRKSPLGQSCLGLGAQRRGTLVPSNSSALARPRAVAPFERRLVFPGIVAPQQN